MGEAIVGARPERRLPVEAQVDRPRKVDDRRSHANALIGGVPSPFRLGLLLTLGLGFGFGAHAKEASKAGLDPWKLHASLIAPLAPWLLVFCAAATHLG